jgi:hypothetical protein
LLELIIEAFFYIMSFYGVLSLTSRIMRKLWFGISPFRMIKFSNEGSIRTILVVKDQEETIEGIIRSYYICRTLENITNGQSGHYYGKNYDKGIIVVDMGSKDKTLEILQKLQGIYGSLEVLSAEEKDKVLEHIIL